MTTALAIAAAFILILVGHIVRSLRQIILLNNSQAQASRIIRACGAGQIADLFIPWRLGELARAFVASDEKLKFGHILSSLIVERCLDILFLAAVSTFLVMSNISDAYSIVRLSNMYLFGAIALSSGILLGLWSAGISRQIVWAVSNLFFHRMQFAFLAFMLSIIDSLKIIIKSNRWIVVSLMSCTMWTTYVAAYFVLFSTDLMSVDSIVQLFGMTSITSPRILDFRYVSFIAIFGPSFVLPLFPNKWGRLSEVITKVLPSFGANPAGHLPFVSSQAEREFLTRYFSSTDRDWCSAYRAIYSDVSLVSDCSGLSSATTTRVLHRDGRTTYRKFQIGEGHQSLKSQFLRLKQLSNRLPVAQASSFRYGDNYFAYDMSFTPEEVTFSQALHTLTTDHSLQLVQRILSDLDSSFSEFDPTLISRYDIQSFTEEKLNTSIRLLSSHAVAGNITNSSEVAINGKHILSIGAIAKSPSFRKATTMLAEETFGVIHGDLTLDNIIVNLADSSKYYLIDPSTEISLPSRTHDVAKLLQSTVTRQSLTCRYYFSGDWTKSVSLRVIDEPQLSTFSDRFVASFIANLPERDQITLRIRLMTHWLRLVVHRIKCSDPQLNLYLGALLAIWNNCASDIKNQSYDWRQNYCII